MQDSNMPGIGLCNEGKLLFFGPGPGLAVQYMQSTDLLKVALSPG